MLAPDPKLSDGGARCRGSAVSLRGAAAVTCGAVGCSVWLSDFVRRSERVSPGVKRDNLMCPERVETVRVTRLVAKLDLESVVGENLDHSANLTGDETQLGQVADESHGVEQMDAGSSRHIEVSNG